MRATASCCVGLPIMMMAWLLLMTAEMAQGSRLRHGGATARKELLDRLADILQSLDQEKGAHRAGGSGQQEHEQEGEEERAARWMQRTNEVLRQWQHRMAVAEWDFITNINPHTQQQMLEISKRYTTWRKAAQAEGRQWRVHNLTPNLRRQLQMFTMSADSSNVTKTAQTAELQATMETTYNKATVCLDDLDPGQHPGDQGNTSTCLSLEPALLDIMAQSRDADVLLRVWQSWRDASGKPQRQIYQQFVQLLNDGAVENGYSDYGEAWRETMFPDNTDAEKMAADLWAELRPLYLQLHAYVRHRLRQMYGNDTVGTDGTIPAHLLGNMWAQSWINLLPLVIPYPDLTHSATSLDSLLQERYTVHGLFQLSEQFYRSLGLYNMTDKFWASSMLTKPTDGRVAVCHGSASDMYSPGDFRIKMCTDVTMGYLDTVHHEMGHVQYFMAYSHQPTVFRDGANCAFHEAIGDTIALSVLSRTHLRMLGLVQAGSPDEEEKQHLNSLMSMALIKIGFLPFGLLVDRWRWQVFSGQTAFADMNKDWWKFRLDLQGLRSPVPRSEEDFDPATKFHVPSNSPYMCYFISFVAQFQFYKTMCKAKGHHGPLHLCDFYGSLEAGSRFKRFMAAGASRPWQDVLQEFTGSRTISAQALLEYFEPLAQWLEAENVLHGEPLGWEGATINWQD